MIKYVPYDIAIIGGGISSCVFASSYIKKGFDGKIVIIENGRGLGGRSSTRKSRLNNGWKLNHGSPNLNIINSSNNKLLNNFILDLVNANIIKFDNSEIIKLNGNSIINSNFYKGDNYISTTTMSDLCQNIISLYDLNNQIDFLFETLIVKLEYKNNLWILTTKNGHIINAKYLIFSSNLLLHKRSLDILNIEQIPLRKSIPINKDKIIDLIINLLAEQDYIQRLTFLIYTNSNYCFKDNYQKRYRHFVLSNELEKEFQFERIIFQKQANNDLGIVIHTRNIDLINEYLKIENKTRFKSKILIKLNKIFHRDQYINQLNNYKDFSIMTWRASQPSKFSIPENLQVCENYKIGFCGDWFDMEGFGRVEGAILSALKLSYKVNWLI